MIRGATSVPTAMAGAAAMGALVLAAQGVVLALVSLVILRGESAGLALFYLLMLASPVAITASAVGFLIGQIVLGMPAWLLLHRLGRRRRRDAMIAGAVLSTLAAWANLSVWFYGGPDVAWAAMLFLIPGAAAGWTLHRIAYGASPHGGLPRSSARR